MLTVAIPKRNKLQNIIVLTPKDGGSGAAQRQAVIKKSGGYQGVINTGSDKKELS